MIKIKMGIHYSCSNTIHNRSVYKFFLLSICIYHVSSEANIKNTESISQTQSSKENVELAIDHVIRQNKAYKRDYNVRRDNMDYQNNQYDDHDNHMNDNDMNDNGNTKAMSQPKVDYWTGYYDFLINEGSYKFWAVFQLATAALLIYSGFAALYYAKVNPAITDDDFDDIFRRRRRRRRRRRSFPLAAYKKPFAGLDADTFQRIIEAADGKRTHC